MREKAAAAIGAVWLARERAYSLARADAVRSSAPQPHAQLAALLETAR